VDRQYFIIYTVVYTKYRFEGFLCKMIFLFGTTHQCRPRPPISEFRNLFNSYFIGLLGGQISPLLDLYLQIKKKCRHIYAPSVLWSQCSSGTKHDTLKTTRPLW
jgi:hypothetical protein